MKKAFKAVRIILLLAVIVVVALVAAIHLYADRALKIGIEMAGTKALNVGVSVGDVDLAIMKGEIGLENLVIDNPPGYQHRKLLELKDAKIEVDIKSLLGDVVNIREIKLDGINLVLEQRGISGNNLQDVIKSIAAKDKQAEPSGKKLHIDELEITNITVKAKLLPVPGRADTVTLRLNPIKMTNLGGDDKLDTAGLSGKILLAIATGVAEEGVGVLPKEMVDTIESSLKVTLGLGKGIIEGGKDIGKEAVKSAEDIGKGITEGLGGLLKPKKKKK